MASKQVTLTEKQSDTLRDIVTVIKNHNLGDGSIRRSWIGAVSKSVLDTLEAAGLIEQYEGMTRSLALTEAGRTFAIAAGWLAAPEDDEPIVMDASVGTESAQAAFAVGDYVRFATADGDLTGGKIVSAIGKEYAIEETDGVTHFRQLDDIIDKVDMTPKISPFNIGDTVRYIGKNKKMQGTYTVVSTDGRSSNIKHPNQPHTKRMFDGLLELVSRAQQPAAAPTVTEGDDTDLIYNALDELYVIGGKRHEDMAQNAKRAWLDYYNELEAARAEIASLKVEKAHEHEHLETYRVMREIAIAEALGLHRDTFLNVDTEDIVDAITATREQLAACVAALAVALERFSMIKQGVTYKSWEYKQADKAIVEIEALNANANPRTEGGAL